MSDLTKLWEHRGEAVSPNPIEVISEDFLDTEKVIPKHKFSGWSAIRQMRGDGKDSIDWKDSMHKSLRQKRMLGFGDW